jgi:hypothetical protein
VTVVPNSSGGAARRAVNGGPEEPVAAPLDAGFEVDLNPIELQAASGQSLRNPSRTHAALLC